MSAVLAEEPERAAKQQGETHGQQRGERRQVGNRQSKCGRRGIRAGLVHLLWRARMIVVPADRRLRLECVRARYDRQAPVIERRHQSGGRQQAQGKNTREDENRGGLWDAQMDPAEFHVRALSRSCTD